MSIESSTNAAEQLSFHCHNPNHCSTKPHHDSSGSSSSGTVILYGSSFCPYYTWKHNAQSKMAIDV
eukprot:3178720-Amphidinium_carterae.1